MNRYASHTTLIFVAALTLLCASAQGQNLLVNGNFATGSLAPWVAFTTADGTNGSGLPAVVMKSGKYAAHFDVGQVNFESGVQAGGGIGQTVSVPADGTYNVSLTYGSVDDPNGEQNGDAGTFSIVIDGTTVVSKSLGGFTSPHQVIKGTLSGSTTLTSGSHMFQVMITRGYDSSGTATPQEVVTNISLSLQ